MDSGLVGGLGDETDVRALLHQQVDDHLVLVREVESVPGYESGVVQGCLPFLVNFVDKMSSVANKAMDKLYELLHYSKVAALACLVQSSLPLLVLLLGVPPVLQETPEHQQVAGLRCDVDRSAAVAHGQVWVSARLQQDLGALVTSGLVYPGSDVEGSLLLL